MKKTLTLILAAAMLTACSVTASAVDNTGSTKVTYTVDPAYTVVIPESVTLSETDAVTGTIKIYGADENSNVVIPSNQKVNVALTNSENDFNVKNAEGDTIAYTVNDKNAVADLTTVAECNAGAKKDTDVTFKKTGDMVYSGTYSDTLTFTVSLTGAQAQQTEKTITISGVTIKYFDGDTWDKIAEKNDNVSVVSGFIDISGEGILQTNSGDVKPTDVIDPNKEYFTGS